MKEGGPASPIPPITATEAAMHFFTEEDYKKRLRDWFAGMALQGMLNGKGVLADQTAAQYAYTYADALLQQREHPKEGA